MLRALLQFSGLDQRLLAYKYRIEARAERLISHGKAVAIQMVIAAVLGLVGLVIILLAFIAGMFTLYLALVPRLGSVGAAGVVAGVLLVLALALVLAAVITARRQVSDAPPALAAPDPAAQARAAAQAAADTAAANAAAAAAAAQEPLFPPAAPVTAAEIEGLMSLTRRFTRVPEIGVEPLDDFLRGITPRAEEAARDAVARAATLVRTGDRSTMLMILGAAAAAGWALTRAHGPEKGAHPTA